jgi:hypothetical protein
MRLKKLVSERNGMMKMKRIINDTQTSTNLL